MKSFFALFFVITAAGQNFSGRVFESGTSSPIIGANVRWQNETIGAITDTLGRFTLKKNPNNQKLITSFIGFKTDTIVVYNTVARNIYIKQDVSLIAEVTVKGSATLLDRMSPIHTEIITAKALTKAACCNLSESFETNASVSVSYADAVTGSKQIQLLGLSGNYVQTNFENIPAIRGLNTTFGLNFTPGTWVSSIDIAKGVGSVISGYEAMTGQINVELAKPDLAEKMYLNLYANSQGRVEGNLNLAKKLSDKWSVGLLTHASGLENNPLDKINFKSIEKLNALDGFFSPDRNNDGFLDLPKFKLATAMNRWKYQGDRLMLQFGLKGLIEQRVSGENAASKITAGSPLVYSFTSHTERYEWFSKVARLYPSKPYRGLGFITNASFHENFSNIGLRKYDGLQRSVYSNLIYQDKLGNTLHIYKTGLSFVYDQYQERLTSLSPMVRTEQVPGAFLEYTYAMPDKATIVLGGRVDQHNLYGTKFTPRAHMLFHLGKAIQFRMAGGSGWRVPNALIENFGALVSSRKIQYLDPLTPEESWNYGGSLAFDLGPKTTFVLDGYRTFFTNQLIVDLENPLFLRFYNLNGRSFANSYQAELNTKIGPRVDLKAAYRLFDVKNDYRQSDGSQKLLPKQFVNRDRVLANLAYARPYDKWKIDATWQWNSKRRLPLIELHNGTSSPLEAPAYSNFNGQITRTFRKWDVYLGGENLADFRQPNPIVHPEDPFGPDFDANMVWGPVTGRMIYIGIRVKVK